MFSVHDRRSIALCQNKANANESENESENVRPALSLVEELSTSTNFISFHSMDLIFGSLLASTVPIYFKLRLQYITLPFSEEDRITQHVTCNDFDLVVELPEQVELEASTSTSTSTIVLRSARASFLQYSTHLSPLIAFYCSLVRGGAVVGATSRTYTYSEFMDGWFVA